MNRVYVLSQQDNTVTVIDVNNGNATSTVPVLNQPSGLAANPTTNQAYVIGGDYAVMVLPG